MGINNEGIVNRRQLLVRAGSFMKMSWRKSKEELIDSNEDEGNISNGLRKGLKKKKRNLSVRFSDDLQAVSSERVEPMSDEEIENTWYQTADYNRFKKDTVLTSLNYINAKRASKFFDETINCIWGIEEMCHLNPVVPRRNLAEKRKVFRVIREEQARQKKEMQQKQQDEENKDENTPSPRLYPDLEKFRSVSVSHTKGGRDRASARGSEYARALQRGGFGLGGVRTKQPSMKNLFASMRKQSAVAA